MPETVFCARCALPQPQWANSRGYRIGELTYCCVGCGDKSGCICQMKGEPPRLNVVLDIPVEAKDAAANILLVDDKPANLIALEAVLKSPQYRILTTASGPEALEIISREDIALILLDIQMPGMDGYETARRIKESERGKDIPIIFVTAIYREEPHVRQGYEACAIDYFGKPFDVDILQKKVGIYTKLYQQRSELLRKHIEQARVEAILRARNEELEHNFAERATVMDTISEAITVSRGRRISDSNKTALNLFGFDSQDEINRDLAAFASKVHLRDADTGRLLPTDDQPYFRALRGEKSGQRLLIRNAKTGADHVIDSLAVPVLFRNEVIGVVWSIKPSLS